MISLPHPNAYHRKTLSASGSRQNIEVIKPKERLINIQKREKLKALLIMKFNKKFGVTNSDPIIEEEIGRFLQGEKLTEADLLRLESKIQRLIQNQKSKSELVTTLKRDNTQPLLFNNLSKDKREEIIQDQVKPLPSKDDSHLNDYQTPKNNFRPFSCQIGNRTANQIQRKQYKSPEEELKELEAEEEAALAQISSKRKDEERLDFSADGDEWNAIAQYNKKVFDRERLTERLKDQAIKRKTKEDLDLQIKQKITKDYENHLRSLECDSILMKHLEHLKVIEKEKAEAFKQQVLREKVDRENQVKDEQTKKKIELLKQKKLDREYLKINEEQMEKEKQASLLKKKKANDALHEALRENEIAKKKRAESVKQEKLNEILSCEEYGKTDDKRDNERREYFKRIERNGNKYTATKVQEVFEEMRRKNEEEEEKRRQCIIDKEAKDQADEDKKKKELQQTKSFLKSYYDMQVEEKKKAAQFEKQLECEQARIWKKDLKDLHEQEKDINEKIRRMNRTNFNKVMQQIEAKKVKKGINQKMTKEEYLLNKKLLKEVKSFK